MLVVAILLPENPTEALLAALPTSDGERVTVMTLQPTEQIDVAADAVVWCPGTPVSSLAAVFEKQSSIKWLHSLSAGVDTISEFISRRLAATDVLVTNGRGAFSSSLAEYAIGACLYFNKEFGRCVRNRTERKWERFTMDTLAGKTMGFIGYGDIARATAQRAAAFGMRLVAMRRQPDKEASPLLAATYGQHEWQAFYSQCAQ